jgi:hypothetical protein
LASLQSYYEELNDYKEEHTTIVIDGYKINGEMADSPIAAEYTATWKAEEAADSVTPKDEGLTKAAPTGETDVYIEWAYQKIAGTAGDINMPPAANSIIATAFANWYYQKDTTHAPKDEPTDEDWHDFVAEWSYRAK